MKKVFLFLLVLILAVVGYYWYKFSSAGGGDNGPKQQPLTLKKHSDEFNSSLTSAMNAYFEIKAAFVDADTARAKLSNRKFIQLLDRSKAGFRGKVSLTSLAGRVNLSN